MANIKTITVTYGIKRSQNFQTADVQIACVVDLSGTDQVETVFSDTMKRIAGMVEREADAAIKDVVAMSK